MIGRNGTRTFRATAESWLGRFMLPFLFLGLIIVTGVNLSGISPIWGGLGLLALLLLGVFEYAMPMLLSWLALDPAYLEVSLNGRRFRIYWTEVLAAWVVERGRQPYLCLGTREGTAVIPLRFFDSKTVWNEVRGRVSPAALETSAYQRLPDYREWAQTRENFLRQDYPPRQVIDHWLLQVIGWGSMTFFITASVGAGLTGRFDLILAFIPPFVLAALLVANWGITSFDAQGVTRRSLSGVFSMKWEDVKNIEVDWFDTWMVLEGEEKRLSISGPALWIGTGREEIFNLLQAQTEHRHIPLRRSIWVAFKLSRNTRVKTK